MLKKICLGFPPFYDHYTISICASCHNSTAPPIKLNKLSCSNTNLILLKQSCLIGQLNVPSLVLKMHVRCSGVYLYRVPMVGHGPPWDFGSAQALIPLCSAARFRSLLALSRLPRRRLAVLGRHNSRRRRRTNRRPGAARPGSSDAVGRAAPGLLLVRRLLLES